MTPPTATMESATVDPPSNSLVGLPSELRNMIYCDVLDRAPPNPELDHIFIKCRHKKVNILETVKFKKAMSDASLRKVPLIRNDFITLMWGRKTPVLCSCSRKTFDTTFLHFPSHPNFFPTIEYRIHPGSLMKHPLQALKLLVRAVGQMRLNGTIRLGGVLHEVGMFQTALRFLHKAFDDCATFHQAFGKLANEPWWIYASTQYPSRDDKCLVKPKPKRRIRGQKTTKEIFSEARDRALQSGASPLEAVEAAKAARDDFQRSRPKVTVKRYGDPDGVLVKPVHVSWKPRMPIAGL